MKKTLLIALLLIPFIGFSQTTKPIDGFLGIKFGSSKADVTAAIAAKGGTLVKGSTDESLLFTNVSLGQRATEYLQVKLFNDKAYFAAFVFGPENDASTLGYYNSLVTDISSVYGKGKPTADFKDPYKLGDGDETTAISVGKGDVYTDWSAGTHSIQIDINTKLKVVLMYIDDAMDKQARAAKKEKEKSDF